MNPVPPHFILEEGPESGRELVIPEQGARVGRATENDIVIQDASMSRFQCRLYFRDRFLHVMDLGSTNATLVNDLEISDSPLRHGDQVLVGETLMRVVNDSAPPESHDAGSFSFAPQKPAPKPQEEPTPVGTSVPVEQRETVADVPSVKVKAPLAPTAEPAPEPAASENIAASAIGDATVDLGFGKRAEGEEKSETAAKEKRNSLSLVMVALLTVLLVFGAGAIFLMINQKPAEKKKSAPTSNGIQVYYEKVVGTPDNIFRYAVTVKDGEISAQIHDINNERKVERADQLTPKELGSFKDDLIDLYPNYEKLDATYESVANRDYNAYDLTVIIGPLAKTVQIRNQLEPSTFKQLRETVETIADTKLGLATIGMPPEVLRENAQESWEVGNDLYEGRQVKDDNLYQAIQKMNDVTWLLDTIEPKPDYYQQAAKNAQLWSEELDKICQDLWFAAQREAHVSQWNVAIQYLDRLLAARPDEDDQLYQRAVKSKTQLELRNK